MPAIAKMLFYEGGFLMRNEITNRQAMSTIVSLVCYIVSCYIAFSEPWTAGVMKIFMAVILSSAASFVYFCGRLSQTPDERQTAGGIRPIPDFSTAK